MRKTLLILTLVAVGIFSSGPLTSHAAHAAQKTGCYWNNDGTATDQSNPNVHQTLVLQELLGCSTPEFRDAILTWIGPNFRNNAGGNTLGINAWIGELVPYQAGGETQYGIWGPGTYGFWYGTAYPVEGCGTARGDADSGGVTYANENVGPHENGYPC